MDFGAMANAMIVEPILSVFGKVKVLLPNLAGMGVILLVGWGVALLLRKTVMEMLLALKVDRLTEKAGLQRFFEKGKLEGTLTEIISALVYWVVMIVVFITAINAIGLTITVDLLDKMVLYLRRVIFAIFITILGVFFSNVMSTIVATATANAGIKYSEALGKTAKIIVIAFAALTALEQLQISVRIIELAVVVILGSTGLALSIAFGISIGLGTKDYVGKSIQSWVERSQKTTNHQRNNVKT